ncbi:MAG: STAS domain-containing protein [Spirochaetia bacterium]
MPSAESIKILSYDGSVGIERAVKIKNDIMEMFKDHKIVTVNMSRIQKIDLSFIQILYAARREAGIRKKEFHISGTLSESVKDAFLVGGFCKEVGDDAQTLEKQLFEFSQQNSGQGTK